MVKTMLSSRKQSGGVFAIEDQSTSTGDRFFVDSGSATGSDATGSGQNPDKPFLTLNAVIAACTANQGDIIYVMPGHVEDLGVAETIDFDTAGITCIGLGTGTDRPRIDFNAADSAVNIGASNVTLRNLTFRPGITSTLIGVDVEATFTDFRMEDCEFMVGEAAGTDEFVVALDLKSANHDSVIRNNVFRTDITDDGCTAAILMAAASARITIADNFFYGNYSTAAIDDGAACTELLIEGNRMKVKDGEPGIELTATTTGIIRNNAIESTGLADPDTAIVAADCAWFSNFVVVADGGAMALIGSAPADSIEGSIGLDVDSTETDNLHGKIGTDTEMADNSLFDLLGATAKTDDISGQLSGTGGITTWKSAAAPATGVSISEAIRWIADRQLGDGTDASTNSILGKRVTRAGSALLSGGTVNVFTVGTGRVLVTALFGAIETAAVDTQANTLKFTANPTTGSVSDMSAVSADMTDAEIGAQVSILGLPGDATQFFESGATPSMTRPQVVAAGVISTVSSADSDSGGATLALELWYIPLDDGATVVTA